VELYIRIGLLLTWVGFAVALLLWWRRRQGAQHFAYSERATVILEAIRDGLDLGIIYWSKSEKKFIRRVITPQHLDGYSLHCFDQTKQVERIFKVTRMRLVEIIPAGAVKRPPSRTKLFSWAMVSTTAIGFLALALLGLTLVRGQGPRPATNFIVPAIEPPALMVTTNAIPEPPVPPVPVKLDEDDYLNPPATTNYLAQNPCQITVIMSPRYKAGEIASALRMAIRLSDVRLAELESNVRQLGEAVVWTGNRRQSTNAAKMLINLELVIRVDCADEAAQAP